MNFSVYNNIQNSTANNNVFKYSVDGYRGLYLYWKPDKVSYLPNAQNTGCMYRNAMSYAANPAGWFISVCIPLQVIFYLCNDYTKVMWGLKHTIRITRVGSIRAIVRSCDAAGIANIGLPANLSAAAGDGNVVLSSLR